MSKSKYLLGMIMLDHENSDEGLRELIIEALRSDDISKDERERIADMLEPKSSRTNFRLKLVRRPGNRQQMDDDRLYEFEDIYDAVDGNDKEALDQAELPKKYGGMDVSRVTARKYLDALKAYRLAKQEA